MGIPAYFRVITQQHKGILHSSRPSRCDHYFVDFNGIIHQAAQRVLAATPAVSNAPALETQDHVERLIMNETCNYLYKCIAVAEPTKMVHTCADGVAPIAKMNQQRKRRYLSVLQKKLINRSGATASDPAKAYQWDTNAISPGTAFMSKLDVHMRKHVREHPLYVSNLSSASASASAKSNTLLHYISGADECGEGEHKLFARMGMLADNETAFIYGLDADLIMLSLMSHKPNVYLMREVQHVHGKHSSTTAQRPDTTTRDEPEYVYMNVHALRVALLTELANTHAWKFDYANDPYCQSARDIIESYVTLCFILGNDFLPHMSTLSLKKNGHNKLLSTAKYAWDVCGHAPVVEGKISTRFFAVLLQALAKDEDTVMAAVNEEYLKKKAYVTHDSEEPEVIQCYALQAKNKDPLAQIIYNCTLSTGTNTNASTNTSSNTNSGVANGNGSWRPQYYKHLFHCKMNDMSTVALACRLFITGIFWTYSYYKRLPKDHEWYYPYNYAPTLLDLSNNMHGTRWDTLQQRWSDAAKSHQARSEFVEPHVQLLTILPVESAALLPRKYKDVMTDPTRGCVHMFPVSYPVQTYLKTHLWECAPVLPMIDTEWIERCVANM